MKKITTLLVVLFLVSTGLFAQEKASKVPTYQKMMYDSSINFYTVCDSAEAYFKTIDKDKKGSGYKPFLRWKYINESKYYPSGNRLVDESMPYNEYLRIKRETLTSSHQRSTQSTQGWQSLGPDNITTVTGHYSTGLGRVEFVEVNKNNDQEIYLGSRSGGLWRTSDGGVTWSHNTDFLPASGVNAVAANPTNFNSVLINVQNARNNYSHGVYKSNDGGATFTPTNFLPANVGFGGLGSNFRVYTIQYHPTIPNLVFVGTSQGLYRSTDNLQTWTQQIAGGDVMDIDFHPTNPNIIYIYDDFYAANQNKILKSTDLGLTYVGMATLSGNGGVRLKISVSATCPDCVFVSSDNGIWKSTDVGATYTIIQNPAPAGVSLWGAMPNDIDTTQFVAGYVDLFRSTDSGATFNKCTWWYLGDANNGTGSNQQNYTTSPNYVHADTNYLDCVNGVFYSCSDGFLSKSTDNGVTWQKLSLSVGIRENYCVGTSQSDKYVSICGSQDNGTSIVNQGGWIEAYGADGMEAIVMPLNPKFMIGSTQNGGRGRYTDGTGEGRTGITPPGQVAYWVAPLVFDPNNHMAVYSFGTKVHKSTDYGTTWVDLGTPATLGGTIETAAIAENNSNIMVVTKGSAIEISTDGGSTFSNIKNGLPNASISDVQFDPNNDARIIITYDSYQNNGQKIYITNNSGLTWQNITYNLGNMPILSVVIDHTASSTIYVGAEIGVYKKTMSATTWTLYNTNLPNVTLRDLEINYGSNTIKAASWGRGLWEEKLADRENFPSIVKTEITNPPSFDLPKATSSQFVTSQIEYSGTLTDVHVAWAVNTPSFNATNVIPMTLQSGTIWVSNSALPDFPAGTKVFFKVVATGSNSDTSETYKFMYELKPYEFCLASGENTNGALWINNFSCSNVTNVTNAFNAYSYYSANTMVLYKNRTYTATGNFSQTWGDNDFVVWIDYNNNLSFEETERVVLDMNTGGTGIGSFVIPANAYEGLVRMRVRLGYWGDYSSACGTTLGEVEDYLVKIDTLNVSFTGNTSFCVGSPVQFTYTGSTDVTNVNWDLYNGLNTYNFVGTSVNTTALPVGDYRVMINVTKNGAVHSEAFSNYFIVHPVPTTINITNSNQTICPNTIQTLIATGGVTTGNRRSRLSGNVNLSIPDAQLATGVSHTLSVSDIPSSATITQIDVVLNIIHPWDADLRINLEAPNGKIINLFNQHGSSGDNLTNTIITSNTSAPTFTTAPFTGTFRATLANQTSIATTPAVNSTVFSDLFTMANGDWKVRVYDDGSNDLGTLVNCGLVITYNSQEVVWLPTTNLFTDVACSTPYINGLSALTVYAKPISTITYSASANPNVCSISDEVTFATELNKYTSGSWTNGNPPAIGGTQMLEFDDPNGFTSTSDVSGCSCTITSGNVVINSGHDLVLQDALHIVGGSLTLQNNANLIQVNNVANSGQITVKRNSNALKRLDYTIWSSPVVGIQTLKQFSPFTLNNRFYNYNTSTNLYNAVANPVTQEFDTASGYLIRMPDNHPTVPTIWEGVFNGVANNGTIPKNITYISDTQGFNMIGNPYPSTIDADAFLLANSATIEGTIYYWRKTNNALGTAYATYTLGGATTTSPTSPVPTNIIQVGQGFLVEAKNVSNPQVVFSNAFRLGNNANLFFRNNLDVEQHRIWINLTNSDGLFSQLLVGYMTNATQGIDSGIDGKYVNDSAVSLTSIIDGEEFTIQGRTLPFAIEDIVPLSFKTNNAGSFSISIDHVDGLFSEGQEVFLKDNFLNTIHNLNQSSYDFSSDVGSFSERFEIVYQSAALLNDEFESDTILMHPNPVNGNGILYFNGLDEATYFTLYDVTGKLIHKELIVQNKVQLNGFSKGVYLVKLESEAKNSAKKLIIK